MKVSPLLLILFTGHTLAEEVKQQVPSVDPVSSSYLLKLTAGLGFILLLILALAWLMKKMQLTQHSQNGLIKIISSISVGQRDRIALIQVGDEQILVGLTPGRMQKLHRLKTSLVLPQQSTAKPHQFTQKFNQLLKRDNSHVD